jgi:hypothetical protein
MKTQQEYISDLSEIRSMMERSTRFLSLTGWSGILAGIYALAGTIVAFNLFLKKDFFNLSPVYGQEIAGSFSHLAFLALAILILTLGTAVVLSMKKAAQKKEKLWNASARRLVSNLAIPLVTGGLFILILISKGFYELAAPLTLVFYGMGLLNASKFTFEDVKYLGAAQIAAGLLGTYYSEFGLFFWAAGFGILHIVYGIYMHLRYEK